MSSTSLMSRPAIGCGTDGVIAMSSARARTRRHRHGGGRGRRACFVCGACRPERVAGRGRRRWTRPWVARTTCRPRSGRVSGPDDPSLRAAEQPRDAHDEQGGDAEHHQPADPVDAGGERRPRVIPVMSVTLVSAEPARSRLPRPSERGASLLASLRSPGVRRSTRRCCGGTTSTRATCPGGERRRRRGACWSPSSCSSRRPVARVLPVYEAWLRALADPGRPRRRTRRGGDPGLGTARLPAPGARGCTPRPPRSPSSTAARCPTPTTRCARCPASATTRPRPCSPSRSAAGSRCSTPTSAGCWRAW